MRRSAVFAYLPGGLVLATGAALGLGAMAYPLGTMLRPGPGFFPLLIAGLLMLMGLGVVLETRRSAPPADPPAPMAWRALIGTIVAILIFAFSLERLGFVPATLLLVAVCGLSTARRDWRMLGVVALVLSVLGSVVFLWGLGLPLNMFGAS